MPGSRLLTCLLPGSVLLRCLCRAAKVGETAVALGDVVSLLAADEVSPALGLVQALWQTEKGDKQVQVRAVARGSETVLSDAASADELFVTSHLLTR